MQSSHSSPVSGLVFDLDGVLILSRDAHRQAFEEVLAPFGILNFDYDQFAGWRTPEVFRAVFQQLAEPVPEETVADCSRRKSARARDLLANGNHTAPDCVPLLTRLSEKYRLALASSGSRESVNAFLDRTGLRGIFQSVLSGDDVDRAKPDPEIFRRSIAALGLQPENCAVIEDAVAGVQAARSAGAHTIGFGNGDTAGLSAAGAEQVVASLGDLQGALDLL
jgi:HAD superfamily hydrolase (TIGR01509 family)